jgi:hypothetical protein
MLIFVFEFSCNFHLLAETGSSYPTKTIAMGNNQIVFISNRDDLFGITILPTTDKRSSNR